MKTKDKVIIGFLSLFVVIAWTIELFWFVKHNAIAGMGGLIGKAFALYGRGDSTWFNVSAAPPFAMAFMLCLEAIHIFGSQLLNIILIRAIWLNRGYRYKLQLLIGSYVSYSVIVYYLTHWIAGFSCMAVKDIGSMAIFILFNLPYLVVYGFLVGDAWEHIKE